MTDVRSYPMTDLEVTVPESRAPHARAALLAAGFSGWQEWGAGGYWEGRPDGAVRVFRILAPTWLGDGRPALQALAHAARKAAPHESAVQVVQRPNALVLEA